MLYPFNALLARMKYITRWSLMRVIEHNEGGANKDLAKFADQINALCDKWDR